MPGIAGICPWDPLSRTWPVWGCPDRTVAVQLWDSLLVQRLSPALAPSPQLGPLLAALASPGRRPRACQRKISSGTNHVTVTQGLCWNISIAWRRWNAIISQDILGRHPYFLSHPLPSGTRLSLSFFQVFFFFPIKFPQSCLWPILASSFPSYFFLIVHHGAWQQADKAGSSLEERGRKRLYKLKQIVSGRQGCGEGEHSWPSVIVFHQK